LKIRTAMSFLTPRFNNPLTMRNINIFELTNINYKSQLKMYAINSEGLEQRFNS